MRAGELMRLLMLTKGPKWNLSNMKEMGGKNAVQGVKPNSLSTISPLQSSFVFNYTNVLPSSLLSLGCRLHLVFCQNCCQTHNINGALLLLSFSQGATICRFFHPLDSDKSKSGRQQRKGLPHLLSGRYSPNAMVGLGGPQAPLANCCSFQF